MPRLGLLNVLCLDVMAVKHQMMPVHNQHSWPEAMWSHAHIFFSSAYDLRLFRSRSILRAGLIYAKVVSVFFASRAHTVLNGQKFFTTLCCQCVASRRLGVLFMRFISACYSDALSDSNPECIGGAMLAFRNVRGPTCA